MATSLASSARAAIEFRAALLVKLPPIFLLPLPQLFLTIPLLLFRQALILLLLPLAAVFAQAMEKGTAAYLAGGAILFAAGMYDDFKGLGYQTKFIAQLLAALSQRLIQGLRTGISFNRL